MKKLLVALVLAFVAMPSRGGNEIEFRLTTADARGYNADSSDAYLRESGDAEGPFRHVGGVVANAAGLESLSTGGSAGGATLHPAIRDANALLHAEYFVNSRGNGFCVLHRRAVEPSPAAPEAPEDTRPELHVELSAAAKLAVSFGNTRLLEALLQAGLSINEPLDLDAGWTALHCSVVHGQLRTAGFLLDNGAWVHSRDRFGRRPIDIAFGDRATELCDLLRVVDRKEDMVDGFPLPMLDEVFKERSRDRDKATRFLSVNGKDPSDALLAYFRECWPNVRRRSVAEEVASETQKADNGDTWYRDRQAKDYGLVVEVTLERMDDATYSWVHRWAAAPALGGGGTSGRVSRKYGYWLLHDTTGWDE